MIITAYNPSTENLEMSYLSFAYSVGVTEIVIKDSDRFAVDDRILIGEMGFEQSEVVTVSAVNADKKTLTISATVFPHSANDSVYVLTYDQISFYRSTTTIDGIYAVLATVSIDVDNSSNTTSYDDPTGLTSYYYENSFYHSIDLTESDLSDPMSGQGYSRNQAGAIINDFLTEVGDLSQSYMNVPQALSILNECNDDLSTQSAKPYRTQKTSELLNITAGSDRVALPETLQALHRIGFNYTSGITNRTDNIEIIDIEEMEYIKSDNTAQTTNDMLYVAIDDSTNELVLYPTPTTSQSEKIKIFFWKKFPDFTGMATEINLPTPRVYKLFLTARFYRMRALHDQSFLPLSDRYAADYGTEVVKLQRINRLDRGSQRGYRPDTRQSRQLRKY